MDWARLHDAFGIQFRNELREEAKPVIRVNNFISNTLRRGRRLRQSMPNVTDSTRPVARRTLLLPEDIALGIRSRQRGRLVDRAPIRGGRQVWRTPVDIAKELIGDQAGKRDCLFPLF